MGLGQPSRSGLLHKLQAMNNSKNTTVAFIGGGNMASALIGGLVRSGHSAAQIVAIEPFEAQRARLLQDFGVVAQASADARLAAAHTVVWAVKPQLFTEAAAPCAPYIEQALQVSVMAGVRSDSIVHASGSPRVVRAMPNTPALIGQGIAGLYARPTVDDAARSEVQALFEPTGAVLWLNEEADLDAVTALSGSGPAYVFYFIEAMMQAATEMGLSEAHGRLLAQSTFAGAAALAQQSPLSPTVLREQVTSKGGTTYAAISSLQASDVKAAFVKALHAARDRAIELGRQT